MRQAFFAALLVVPATAWGHGRFARTVDASFGTRANVVSTTYGLLVGNQENEWRWVCSEAVGYDDDFLDPPVAVFGSRLFAATTEGLRVSSNGGCAFSTVTSVPAVWVTDVVATRDAVWASTAAPGDGGLWRSVDGGASFERVMFTGKALAPVDLDVDGDAVRVVGIVTEDDEAPEHVMFTGTDGGASWSETLLPQGEGTFTFLDAAGDVLLVRQDGRQTDRVHRSVDGGVTWAVVLEAPFELSHAAGPASDIVLVAAGEGGVYASSDKGASFAHQGDAPALSCLAARPGGDLVGCVRDPQNGPGFLARWQEDRFEVLSELSDIVGPVRCAIPDAAQRLCQQRWPDVRDRAGIPAADPGPPAVTEAPASGCGCGVTSALVLVPLWPRRRRRQPASTSSFR